MGMDMYAALLGRASSGGSGLPTPTAEDVGKVATVEAIPVLEPVELMPEQTLAYDSEADSYPISIIDENLIIAGKIVYLTIDGHRFVAEVEGDADPIILFSDNYADGQMNDAQGRWVLFYTLIDEGADQPATITISATTDTQKNATIVPEQTIVANEEYVPIENANKDLFVAGTQVTATINGTTYTGTVPLNAGDPVVMFYDGDTYCGGFDIFEGVFEFLSPEYGSDQEYTISLIAVAYTYEWRPAEPSGGGGGSSGVMVVHGIDDTGELDKTWQEINDAVASGMVVTVVWDAGDIQLTLVSYCSVNDGVYSVELWRAHSYDSVYYAVTDSADGYPIAD